MLKLISETPCRPADRRVGEVDGYRFDRRRSPRHAVTGQVMAIRRNHDVAAYRHRICSLELQNMSEGGVAATSAVPLQIDEPIAVCFERGVALWGHVIRCQPARADATAKVGGYEIAIRFDPAKAA